MDLGRLRGTDYVVGVLALALLGSLFLDWYRAGISGVSFDAGPDGDPALGAGQGPVVNAFEAFGATDVVLTLFALMAIGIVVLTVTQRSPAVPVAWTSLTALVSLFATGFMIVAALSVPEDGYTREVGPAVGLALTLALSGAVWSAMRNERPGPSFARSERSKPETLPISQP